MKTEDYLTLKTSTSKTTGYKVVFINVLDFGEERTPYRFHCLIYFEDLDDISSTFLSKTRLQRSFKHDKIPDTKLLNKCLSKLFDYLFDKSQKASYIKTQFKWINKQ